MATEETRSRSPKKTRGINWTDEATEALLELWAEESILSFFFWFGQDVDQFPCWTEDGSSCYS